MAHWRRGDIRGMGQTLGTKFSAHLQELRFKFAHYCPKIALVFVNKSRDVVNFASLDFFHQMAINRGSYQFWQASQWAVSVR